MIKDLEKKIESLPTWQHDQLAKLARELLLEMQEMHRNLAALREALASARELLNEYRRGLK